MLVGWKKWLIILIFLLSGCSSSPDFKVYEGKPLSIAVIGEPPEVREENITFSEVTFEDLNNLKKLDHDAVFITEENLKEASAGNYEETYLNSDIPFFFLEAWSHIPFTERESEMDQNWKWSPGKSFAVGILSSGEDDSLNSWGYSLYNDEKTDETVDEVFSRIFTTIEELNH
ncbi:hypothetical protein FZC79_15590 [Rossellomorea vietnamensis]|uniref:Lipoprotein n=1 Tax=Rossellomorea vietnamensis TaxID=218284 RepID=A0A5D4KA24_9BACI|nr:hypothetical protein FZC79_15590 [Rossellomorea vietnamensis]